MNGFNSLDDLSIGYEKLWQKTKDRSSYQFFTCWKDYEEKRDLLIDRAEELGVARQFRESIRETERRRREVYETGSELNGGRARRIDDFQMRSAEFLWKPYLPIGEYTVLMAAGGTGKTYFCCGLAAELSQGRVPLGNRETEKKNVLFISGEDTGGELRSRLTACGADLSHIFVIDALASAHMSLSESPVVFETAILENRADLVVIDPWQAFLGARVDMNRVNEVRPVLQELACIAKRTKCAVLLVSHVSKRQQFDNINNAAIGSADLVNAARSAFYLLRDPDNGERIAVHSKSNYAPEGPSIRFSIGRENGVNWLGCSPIDRTLVERASGGAKSVFQLIRDQDSEMEELRPVGELIATLAKPFGRVAYSYDRLKKYYGAELFGDRKPKAAIERASQLFPMRDYEIVCGKVIREKDEKDPERSVLKRGVEIRWIKDRQNGTAST